MTKRIHVFKLKTQNSKSKTNIKPKLLKFPKKIPYENHIYNFEYCNFDIILSLDLYVLNFSIRVLHKK